MPISLIARWLVVFTIGVFATSTAVGQSSLDDTPQNRVTAALSVVGTSALVDCVVVQAEAHTPPGVAVVPSAARRALTRALAYRLTPRELADVQAHLASTPAQALDQRLAEHPQWPRLDLLSALEQSADAETDPGPWRQRLSQDLATIQWPPIDAERVAERTKALLLRRDPDRASPGFRGTDVEIVSVQGASGGGGLSELLEPLDTSTLVALVSFYDSPVGARYTQAIQDAVVELAAQADAESIARFDAHASVEVYDVVDRQPELIGGLDELQQRLLYPRLARDAGIQGTVFVQFVVDESGAIVDPVVTRTPSDLLSAAALKAVRESRFAPGLQRGRPVRVNYSLPVVFDLD